MARGYRNPLPQGGRWPHLTRRVKEEIRQYDFRHPHAFPQMLIDSMSVRLVEGLGDNPTTPLDILFQGYLDQAEGGWGAKYRQAFSQMKSDLLRPTAVVARGLHDLSRIDVARWLDPEWEGVYDDAPDLSASLNVYRSAGGFTVPSAWNRKPLSALLIWQIDSEHLYSFGEDSESGSYNEAEVKISPRCLPCLQHVFVKGAVPEELRVHGARRVSEAARRLYGLGTYALLRSERIYARPGRPPHSREEGVPLYFPISFATQLRRLARDLNRNPGDDRYGFFSPAKRWWVSTIDASAGRGRTTGWAHPANVGGVDTTTWYEIPV